MINTNLKRLFIFLFSLALLSGVSRAEIISVNFDNEAVGKPAKMFSSFGGEWYIEQDDNNKVYAVDGRHWIRGTMSAGLADKAKALFGNRYTGFLNNLTDFPLTIYRGIKDFSHGTISVDFKSISGRIDQAAGIAFNIQPNGDYLVIRANPLENNLVAFKIERGERSVVQWVRDTPTASLSWHTLKVVINADQVEGYLNNKRYITFKFKKPINGKIGLWSKADSYVFFDNFIARTQ